MRVGLLVGGVLSTGRDSHRPCGQRPVPLRSSGGRARGNGSQRQEYVSIDGLLGEDVYRLVGLCVDVDDARDEITGRRSLVRLTSPTTASRPFGNCQGWRKANNSKKRGIQAKND